MKRKVPSYKESYEEHDLKATIKGMLSTGSSYNEIQNIKLIIQEISREESNFSLIEAEKAILEMKQNNLSTLFVEDALIEAKRIFEQAKYAEILRNEKAYSTQQVAEAKSALRLVRWKDISFSNISYYTDLIEERRKTAYLLLDRFSVERKKLTESSESTRDIFYRAEISFREERYNETLFIEDNNFASLCVKDAEVLDISEISSSCNGANETNLTGCLGASLTSNGIICIDQGSTIKIDNLRYSAVLGVPESETDSEDTSSSENSLPIFYPNSIQIENGYTKLLATNWQIKFKFENYTHTLKVVKIDKSLDQVSLVVYSEKQEKNLSIGEEWKIDLNNDKILDYQINFYGFKNNFVNISLTNITKLIKKDKISKGLDKSNNSTDSTNIVSVEKNLSSKSVWFFILVLLTMFIFYSLFFVQMFVKRHGWPYSKLAAKYFHKNTKLAKRLK